jgi:phosphoribosylformimino-5-aminoimidazole carboxamide ribotide isomerase
MEILPAIDLREGKVVRLQQGDYDLQTTYSADPVAIGRTIAEAGVGWIHVVDLDAARSGLGGNTAAVRSICKAVGARVELGGGMRSEQAVRGMLDLGVERVIVGSAALADWRWFEDLVCRDDLAGRVALGLDARGGALAVHGWTQQVDATAVEVASRTAGWPLAAIIHTDISRDGMMTGVNVAATAELIGVTDVPVIASGGVASPGHVLACKKIGCWGVIIGKAWYEGRIDLSEARRLGE